MNVWWRARWLVSVAAILTLTMGQAVASESAEVGGIRAYFGMVPAALIDAAALRHGRDYEAWTRSGPASDAHHLLVALFDAPSGERITDAEVVVAHLQPSGGSNLKKLNTLHIGDAITYAALMSLSGHSVHQFEIRVRRAGTGDPVIFHYRYDTRH